MDIDKTYCLKLLQDYERACSRAKRQALTKNVCHLPKKNDDILTYFETLKREYKEIVPCAQARQRHYEECIKKEDEKHQKARLHFNKASKECIQLYEQYLPEYEKAKKEQYDKTQDEITALAAIGAYVSPPIQVREDIKEPSPPRIKAATMKKSKAKKPKKNVDDFEEIIKQANKEREDNLKKLFENTEYEKISVKRRNKIKQNLKELIAALKYNFLDQYQQSYLLGYAYNYNLDLIEYLINNSMKKIIMNVNEYRKRVLKNYNTIYSYFENKTGQKGIDILTKSLKIEKGDDDNDNDVNIYKISMVLKHQNAYYNFKGDYEKFIHNLFPPLLSDIKIDKTIEFFKKISPYKNETIEDNIQLLIQNDPSVLSIKELIANLDNTNELYDYLVKHPNKIFEIVGKQTYYIVFTGNNIIIKTDDQSFKKAKYIQTFDNTYVFENDKKILNKIF